MFKFSIGMIAALIFTLPGLAQTPYMTEPSLSPDSKEIVFVSGGDIWSVPSDGGTARLLVSHPATESKPLFSPDGKYLAFGSSRTGNGDIYILDLASGDLRRLTFDDVNEQLDGWSRDGKWIYFTSSARDISGMGDIFRVAASGGTPMQVSADRYTAEFEASPLADGSFIFAARGNSAGQWWRKGSAHLDQSEIWMRSGNNYTELTKGGAKQMWPMATADGSRVYFMSDRSGAQNIWMLPKGGQEKQLTNFTNGRVIWPMLSYDGQEIVFERNFHIWKMNASSGKAAEVPITLRGAASSPMTERVTGLGTQLRELELSPDGKKIAVIARGEVFAASAKDGGDAVRITNTPAAETYLAWTSDSKKLVYGSERNDGLNLYEYDFTTEAETPITSGHNIDSSPVFSPDGKSLAFIRNARSLMVYDMGAKKEREVSKIYIDPEPILGTGNIHWSPDGKWLAFLTVSPETRSYTNVSVVSAAGGAARPVSFLANSNAASLQWSPDGSYILFGTSQRTEDSQIARIDLKLRTPRFREDQFRDLFREENPRQRPTQPGPSPVPSPAAPAPTASPEEAKKDDSKATEIVFNEIRKRLSFLNTGLNSGGVVISPDGKTAVLIAQAEGQVNLYTVSMDELATDQSAKQLTSTPGFKSNVQFSPDSKEVYYLENGRVQIAGLDKRDVRPVNINIDMNVDLAKEKMEVFHEGWRDLRDNFFDEKFNGVNWDAVRTEYEPLVQEAKSMDEVRRLMNMMVGELNASHLGVGGPSGFTATPVGKLGLRFDTAEYENSGRLKITEVITLGPAVIVKGVNVGDYILSVDGTKIAPGANLDEILEGKVNKRVVVSVATSADGTGKHDVILKPVNTNTEKGLLYRQWVEANRAYVDKISGGKIGYVHLPDMGEPSLRQLYIDLDAENQGKQGVVIDIRNNNGGFINPYVIDVLSRKGYLTMQARDEWTVPGRSNLGQRSLERPTVLVTNSHSLSDAEDFTEGYRSLKLGKVVGEPTSGWIIFTWNTTLFDGTSFRLPRQRIRAADGSEMELHPRAVDVPVTRPIGETYTGRDSQLDAAVKVLLGNQ
jgi:tricorn protease